jgi:dihydrofolate reductase
MARVRVFLATSLDGMIAGEDDDLSWLPPPDPGGDDHGFAALLAETGALLMGRRTYDVASGFDGPWPYGSIPVLVATHRPLAPNVATVRAVSGTIGEIVSEAQRVAGARDVYLDGGGLVRAALEAALVDQITITIVPVVLGRGVPLFAGVAGRHRLALEKTEAKAGGLVQLTYAVPRV